ncbi:MAG: hypothetical protein AABZ47_10750 [Planctomycetota bacterium]
MRGTDVLSRLIRWVSVGSIGLVCAACDKVSFTYAEQRPVREVHVVERRPPQHVTVIERPAPDVVIHEHHPARREVHVIEQRPIVEVRHVHGHDCGCHWDGHKWIVRVEKGKARDSHKQAPPRKFSDKD